MSIAGENIGENTGTAFACGNMQEEQRRFRNPDIGWDPKNPEVPYIGGNPEALHVSCNILVNDAFVDITRMTSLKVLAIRSCGLNASNLLEGTSVKMLSL